MTKRVSRKYLIIPYAIAGALLAVWFAIWNVGASTMRSKLEQFAADRAAEGGEVAYAPLKTRGFPFYLRGSADDFKIIGGRSEYACARLFIDALPYSPNKIIFSCGGEQTLTSGDAVWIIDASDLRASLERNAERGWLAKIETGAASMTDGITSLSAENAIVNITPHTNGGDEIESSLRLTQFKASDALREQPVERLEAAIVIGGKESDASRPLEIVGVEALFDDATFSAKGRLRISGEGAVTGRLDAKIENPTGVATTLANLKILNERDAKIAGSALAMLAVASGGAITAPVELVEDGVKIAGVRISKADSRRQP